MATRHAHCSYCGAAFAAGLGWPRTCGACGNTSYLNPLPVAVLVLPVTDPGGDGLLIVRRNIPPAGKLALPGGFIDHGEAWQAAAARELREEAQVIVDPATIRELRVLSAPDGTLLVFGAAPPVAAADLPPFVPNAETQERLVAREPIELAFPLHTQVMGEWFAGRRPS